MEGSIKWTKNTDSQLDLRHNELAFKVLNEGKIDLKDQRIEVRSIESDLKSINLGPVEIINANSILLKDVDVNAIPDDIDIQLDPRYHELHAVGIVNENGDTNNNLQHRIIEDVSLDQLKEKYLVPWEYDMVVLDKIEALRKLIRTLPAYLILFFAFDTVLKEK